MSGVEPGFVMRKDLILIGTVCFLGGFFLSPLTVTMRLWLSRSITGFSDWLTLMGTDWNRAMNLAIQGFYGTSLQLIVFFFSVLPILVIVVVSYLVYRWCSRRHGQNEYTS